MKARICFAHRVAKSGSKYACVFVDMGYAKRILTCDRALISELTGKSVYEVSCATDYNEENPLVIGEITIK